MTDVAGKVIERFVYGTYGELLSEVTKKVRFLFNGAYGVTTDGNGLYYMRARYYNPDIKRFINQDIKVGDIGSSQSLNRYAYCEGNPVSLIDPFGLSPQETQDEGEKSKYEKWHNALDFVGLFWDGADVINAGLYAAEGKWGKAATSIACALPFIGTVVAGATKTAKFAKVGSMIGKTLQMAGKAYMTVSAATTALDLAGDARIEYATKGGQLMLGVAAKTLEAVAMGAMAVMSGKDIISDTLNLSRLDAQNINFKTNNQETADNISGKNTKCNGVGECFTAGTKIKTADGEKNVEEVNTGDYVLAEDPETGEQEYKKVVHTFINVSWALVHVTVGDEEIETTIEHPFYIEGVGFVSAKNLQPGDIIRTSDGRNLPIQKVELEELEEPVLVYNFEVENFHTYYLLELGVLVHNNCTTETGSRYTKVRYEGSTRVDGVKLDTSRTVYQRNDIDWYRIDPESGMTNFELALNDRSPFANDGSVIELHHILQKEPGPIVELPKSLHGKYKKTLHGLIGDGESFRNDPILEKQYNNFKRQYWRWRAKQFLEEELK